MVTNRGDNIEYVMTWVTTENNDKGVKMGIYDTGVAIGNNDNGVKMGIYDTGVALGIQTKV